MQGPNSPASAIADVGVGWYAVCGLGSDRCLRSVSAAALASDRAPFEEEARAVTTTGAGGTGARRPMLVAVAFVGAVLVPLLRGEHHDSLPLSNYPMFTADRDQTADFRRAIGVAADGTERSFPPMITGGSIEVVHAARTLTRAIATGTATELCAEIAERVSAVGADDVEVLVVTERYDIVDALRAADPQPISREVHARCPIAPAADATA